MVMPKKITLFYGHVASNIGDLAINSGTVNLLRSACPGVNIDVVLIDADLSEFLGAAKSSFDDQGDIRFTYLKTHGEKAPLYLRSPETFFAEAGVSDADVVLLSAGEHFFAYQHEENAKSLFWRTFPAYAAKLAGKKCVQLPSTLGPFETDRSSALFSSLLGLTDALAVRDAHSLQLLKTRYATEKPLLLDPAFFLHSPVAAQQAQKKHGATALVMRSEGWGIRLSNASRKEQTERFKAIGYEASKAFAFSLEFASRLLNTTDDVLRVFVQTTADQELADELGRRLPEFLESGRLTIERPYSVQDYLSRLAVVDRVVSNRFHALILGMVVGRQTHGLYFDVHGHKIPGLFNLIESPGRCHNLSNTEPRTAATAVLDEIARETEAQQKSVQKRVEKLRQDTVAWLNDALQKPTSTADARQLLTASVSLGDFAVGQLKASVEGNAKKQIDLAKKSAQAKEAQWAQQRQQLEGELSQATAAHQAALEELKVATAEAQAKEAQWAQQRQQLEGELSQATAEAQRLSAVNQAQLEALQLELPNTLSNKLGTALIEGIKSPTAVAKLPFQLYKLWRESKSQQPPAALGGESFGEVISAYASGGLDAVEKLLESYHLPSMVVANAYTALARHLKQTDAHQAAEAAQRAYMADPKPFRRKWLAFRLNEAGKVLKAGALLDSLPTDIDFSPSETDRAVEIRRKGVQLRLSRLSIGEKSIKTPASKTQTDKLDLSPGSSDQEILDICSRLGWRALLDFAKQMYAPATRSSAAELLRIGALIQRSGIAETEIEFARVALERDRSVATLRECAWCFHRGRQPKDACDLIVELERIIDNESDHQEQKRLQQLKKMSSYQLSLLRLIQQPKNVSSTGPVPGRICYVLHNSLPYATGGYASRSHGVATGLNRNGFNVIALTRPGFPVDVKDNDETDVPLTEVIDGVEYRRVLTPKRKGIGTAQYMSECIDALVNQFEIIRPEIVWAASFYITALPALIAARRLGIPFVYEIRGLAEITKISRDPDYVDTTDYQVQIQMEAATAMNADVVFTLTDAMRVEFERRGISRQKIHLIPNCCDVDRFHPRMRDSELARQLGIPADTLVIGYIGTLVDYEGLDDLATACAILKAKGYKFRLLIVGSENTSRDGTGAGPISDAIRMIAQEHGFSEWLILPGRVPHDQVESYYSLIDIAPFPRRPLPVCEMVSPMKPLEALAMEKAVVVSSVAALREIVRHEQNGLVFEKGDVQSLAIVLGRLFDDIELRLALGKNGRGWVERERTWVASTSAVQSYVRKISNISSPMPVSTTRPIWWQSVPSEFRDRSGFVDVTAWALSDAVKELRYEYDSRFGEEAVAKRVPLSNWQRADICNRLISHSGPSDILDIGSGLGEFVNLFSSTNPNVPISSVDVKDYSLWFDRTGRVQRVYKSIFDLGPDEVRDVVTCFEVIEHLPPERLAEAVKKLRSLARRKLFVSVPFMEPLPLYKGHFTRFDDTNLLSLFPDAKFTIFGKGGKNKHKVHAWIMCEINCHAT
jgi:glycosyltransferase involved in cell wall biosynthesis/polysaccharide pyruvyl transferase WcaK-like protein